jgi:beta-galactosidase
MFLILGPSIALGQSNRTIVTGAMDQVLYGAAYYHEYMPYERLDKDVELMRQAGLNVVRMGESTWTLWEPTDGHFEHAWWTAWLKP